MNTYRVQIEHRRGTSTVAVDASDQWEASRVALEQNKHAYSAKTLGEITCTCADFDGFADCPIHL